MEKLQRLVRKERWGGKNGKREERVEGVNRNGEGENRRVGV